METIMIAKEQLLDHYLIFYEKFLEFIFVSCTKTFKVLKVLVIFH